ncbi:hypothetical protein KM043_008249 [Ampulex compressa]|nr:hypothetical protein KM043_008249 [Ampulex compressa]
MYALGVFWLRSPRKIPRKPARFCTVALDGESAGACAPARTRGQRGREESVHRRGWMRLVRGRRDRCPWDARAFLVREAPETNGRRASLNHAFPREKKLRCVYTGAFRFTAAALPSAAAEG